jgi:hypothetical protein
MIYAVTVTKEQLCPHRETTGTLIFMYKSIMLRQVPTIFFRHITFISTSVAKWVQVIRWSMCEDDQSYSFSAEV